MQIAIVGTGRMEGNIARRLMKHGHEVVVCDAKQGIDALARERATPASSAADLVKWLRGQRTAWVMSPAGNITKDTVREWRHYCGRATPSATAATRFTETISAAPRRRQ